MELQRRCREECQPYFDIMVRTLIMDVRPARCIRHEDGTITWIQPEESDHMKGLRAQVGAIVKRYADLANGETMADNAAKPMNL